MYTDRNILLVSFLGLLAFILLFIAQVKLYHERMIVDSAVCSFVISNEQTFLAPEKRIAAIINQILPVATSYFSHDIKDIVNAFYLNDYLWYLGFFILFLFVLRQPFAAVALLLGYFLLFGYNYFILPYDVPLTWPLLILLMLTLQRKVLLQKTILRWFTIMVCTVFLVFSNPITSITTLFFFGYLLSTQLRNSQSVKSTLTALAIFFFLLLIKNINPDPYDSQRASSIALDKLGGIDFNYLKIWFFDLLRAFPVGIPLLIFTALWAFASAVLKQGWHNFSVLGAYCFTLALFILYGIVASSPFEEITSKALAPLLLLVSYVLCQGIFGSFLMANKLLASVTTMGIAVLLLIQHHYLLTLFKNYPHEKIAVCKQLIEQVPGNGSKYYVNEEKYTGLGVLPEINSTEIILYSGLIGRQPNDAYIVVGDETEIEMLKQLPNDKIYHTRGWSFKLSPNNDFFKFDMNEPWREYYPEIIEY